MDFMKKPAIIETLVDILLCAVPIWVGVMIGLVIGWSWRPRWTGLLYLGLRSKFRFLWTAPPGFGALRLWLAFTALSAFSVARKIWSNFKGRGEGSVGSDLAVSAELARSEERDGGVDLISGASDKDQDIITEKDLEHPLQLLEGKLGEMAWQSLMERSTPSMAFQAWRHDLEAKSMFPSLAGTKRKETALATGANVALAVVLKKKTQQKEWSCALCKVSATSEQGLNDHLKGKKHKAREAELRNNVALAVVSKKKTQQKEWSCALCKVSATSEQGLNDHLEGKKHKAREAELRNNVALAVVSKKKTQQKEWSCALCKVSATSEQGLNDHLEGKKHKAREAELRNNVALAVVSKKKTQQKEWSCALCKVSATSEQGLNDHLEGKKHKAREAELRNNVALAVVSKKKTQQKEWSCALCKVSATSEQGLNDHLEGKKHKAREAELRNNVALAVVSKKKTQQKEWSCALCKVSATSEQGLNDHLKGKKHKAREAELRNNVALAVVLALCKAITSKSTGNCATSSKKTEKNVKTTGSSNLKQGKLLQVKKNGESPEKEKRKAEGTKGKEDPPVQKKQKIEDSTKKKLDAATPQKKKLTEEMKKKKFKFWCEMCQIGAYSEVVMEAHRKGKKHMAM